MFPELTGIKGMLGKCTGIAERDVLDAAAPVEDTAESTVSTVEGTVGGAVNTVGGVVGGKIYYGPSHPRNVLSNQ